MGFWDWTADKRVVADEKLELRLWFHKLCDTVAGYANETTRSSSSDRNVRELISFTIVFNGTDGMANEDALSKCGSLRKENKKKKKKLVSSYTNDICQWMSKNLS